MVGAQAMSVAEATGDIEPAAEARSGLARAYSQVSDPAVALAAAVAGQEWPYPIEEPARWTSCRITSNASATRARMGVPRLRLTDRRHIGRRSTSQRAYNRVLSAAASRSARRRSASAES